MALEPEYTRGGGRIDTSFIPPSAFVTTPMDLAMVATAKRHGELIADLAAKCRQLCKSQMMGVCRTPATD